MMNSGWHQDGYGSAHSKTILQIPLASYKNIIWTEICLNSFYYEIILIIFVHIKTIVLDVSCPEEQNQEKL